MVFTFSLSLSRLLGPGLVLFLHILGALAAPLASNNAMMGPTAHLEQRGSYHWNNVAVTFLPYNREFSDKDNWAIKFGERMSMFHAEEVVANGVVTFRVKETLKTPVVGGSVGRVNLLNQNGKTSAFSKINAIKPTGKAQFLYEAMRILKEDYSLDQNAEDLGRWNELKRKMVDLTAQAQQKAKAQALAQSALALMPH
ncbi:MAG: hypothetical protein NXY57DRAFT_958764 [Lentinula lateritia]|uniref:Uncharacterized protein n=1 Tax=Lentinula lateritia TaxID=40482 RepID=A0ABQ8VF04_9AGAR|nr:MAG: hypothetical protein NXY57DRAFT_958764 [Lentinula lateritia]KAJ4489153.1 hypothetical protein C8R41DRAFT_920580 [Lentinula lateritia]